MTVKQLIDKLTLMNPKSLVVLSRDDEGNGYLPLAQIDDNSKYEDGEIGIAELTDELMAQGYSEEDVMSGGKRCIVLFP